MLEAMPQPTAEAANSIPNATVTQQRRIMSPYLLCIKSFRLDIMQFVSSCMQHT